MAKVLDAFGRYTSHADGIDIRIGKLADQIVPYIRISQRPMDKAMEMVCKSAGVYHKRDKEGVYWISAKAESAQG